MKKKSILLFALIIVLLLTGCQNPFVAKRRAGRFPNTTWIAEDGSVVFYVKNYSNIKGTIIVDNEPVDIFVFYDFGRGMYIYPLDLFDDIPVYDEDQYEYWECFYWSKTRFVATVVESTFFEEGQKIVFNRYEGNLLADSLS